MRVFTSTPDGAKQEYEFGARRRGLFPESLAVHPHFVAAVEVDYHGFPERGPDVGFGAFADEHDVICG
jgi:hypothetical protein